METPIKQAVLGEWKLVDYQNWEGCQQFYNESFDEFSENLKFELVDGERLKVSGGGEGEVGKKLFVEDGHLKSVRWGNTDDFCIEDGRLHYLENVDGL